MHLSKGKGGFTLVEVLIAMVIGLFLMGGVIELFLSTKTSIRLQQQMGYLQENGRMAMELLSKQIRNADYWGCSNNSNVGSVINTASPAYDPIKHGGPDASNGIGGTNNTGLNGSDTITLRGFSSSDSIGIDKDQPQAASIGADSVGDLQQGDVVMISNCKGADIFQITNDPQTSGQIIIHSIGNTVAPGNAATYTTDGTAATSKKVCNDCLHQSYAGGDATIGKVNTTTLSINTGASGEPALFMTDSILCITSCELVEGIENMQILYGEDTDGDLSVNQYVTANNVTDMNNVISVQVSLLARTEKTVATSAQTYTYNGATVTSTDNRLRKVYTSTITIRNRMQ